MKKLKNSKSAIDTVELRITELRKFNYVYNTIFQNKPKSRFPVRKANYLILRLCKMPCNINNLRKARMFFIDKSFEVRYNKGYRFYKNLYCTLDESQINQVLNQEKNNDG